MEQIYARMRERARQIVYRSPLPDFYQDCSFAKALSRQFFETHPLTVELQAFVARNLEEDFGHGLVHAEKVALDAGTLMIVECNLVGHPEDFTNRRAVVAQCAGLLHDIKRKHQNHAVQGADYAKKVLEEYPLDSDEIEDISRAILNHEAFKKAVILNSPEGVLVSDCLYDADKFRWGPDNFTDTLWSMVTFMQIPVSKFMDLYRRGIEKITKIKDTFRTGTGQKYGPQFIDLGLAVGEELCQVISTEFAHLI